MKADSERRSDGWRWQDRGSGRNLFPPQGSREDAHQEAQARPSPQSAPWAPLSNALAKVRMFFLTCPRPRKCANHGPQRRPVNPPVYRRKPAIHRHRQRVRIHRTVTHSAGEYVRYDGDYAIHTNTVENVFSVFKRGMRASISIAARPICTAIWPNSTSATIIRSGLGIEDTERTQAVHGAGGKRLTYHQSGQAAHA